MAAKLTYREKVITDLRSQGYSLSEVSRILKTPIGRVRHLQAEANAKTRPSYIPIRRGKVAKTTEAVPGIVFLDWDEAGNLLGVEALPVE